MAGEFLGIDTESTIFTHFRRHYADWFPGLRQVTRTSFRRQAANLWKVKQELWQEVAQNIHTDPYIYFGCRQLSGAHLSVCSSAALKPSSASSWNPLKQTSWTGEHLSSSNWREVVRRKIESTPWEQAVDDARPFIASLDELGLLTKENLLKLLK